MKEEREEQESEGGGKMRLTLETMASWEASWVRHLAQMYCLGVSMISVIQWTRWTAREGGGGGGRQEGGRACLYLHLLPFVDFDLLIAMAEIVDPPKTSFPTVPPVLTTRHLILRPFNPETDAAELYALFHGNPEIEKVCDQIRSLLQDNGRWRPRSDSIRRR